jgi:nucleoside-diphosphate-sugar epimerase
MMTNKPTILVTGATGFVGRAIVKHLAAQRRSVRAVVRRELSDWPERVSTELVSDISDIPQLNDVDSIIHCAARAHILKEAESDPLAAFRLVNCEATLSLAQAAAQAGVRRFIFISSIGVNGAETSGRPFCASDAPAPHSP